ncbi:MAG: glutathione peroxidase [Pelistega sp.]|nr:glutathione peroxidase [Pelistega sp.]
MITDFPIVLSNGQALPSEDLQGKVILVVNVASKCGFTPQYQGLEELYQRYREQGFIVLAFPCNQFSQQEPGSDQEIQQFCELNYGVSFPISRKIEVKGLGADPLYQWLTHEKKGLLGASIKWNFTKFLINRSGQVVARFAPTKKPEQLAQAIEKLLSD